MSDYDHLWNDLPFDQRQRLAPYLMEAQILHLTQARTLMVQSHRLALQDINTWIANIKRDLAKEYPLPSQDRGEKT